MLHADSNKPDGRKYDRKQSDRDVTLVHGVNFGNLPNLSCCTQVVKPGFSERSLIESSAYDLKEYCSEASDAKVRVHTHWQQLELIRGQGRGGLHTKAGLAGSAINSHVCSTKHLMFIIPLAIPMIEPSQLLSSTACSLSTITRHLIVVIFITGLDNTKGCEWSSLLVSILLDAEADLAANCVAGGHSSSSTVMMAA